MTEYYAAVQNTKMSEATGAVPNLKQKFSAYEKAIYSLIGMRESIEGVGNTFGVYCFF